MINIFRNPTYRNVTCFAIVSFLQALQLLILVAIGMAFIPFKQTDFITKIFPVYLPEVRPEREMLLFRLFVIVAIVIMTIWMARHRRQIDEPGVGQKFLSYVIFLGSSLFAQLFFIFKVLVWGDPLWAKVMMYVTMVASVFAHIFWPELKKLARVIQEKLKGNVLPKLWVFDLAMIGSVLLLLWPSNMDYVLGRMFVKDQFYHLDGFWLAAGWAHLKGLALNLDVISQYSVVLPIFFSEFLKHTVGFTYAHAVYLMVFLVIGYFIGLYFFLKMWLQSRALAAFGLLLAVKLNFFHWGVTPLVWQFPTATPLRFLPDIFFYFFLWQHIQTKTVRWLWAMAAVVGFSLVWTIDVGVYMLAAFAVYTVAVNYRMMIPLVFTALGSALCWLLIAQPQSVFNAHFWHNCFEHASLFLQGWGALPVTEALKEKQFFAFLIGLTIPIVFVFTLIYVGAMCYFKKIDAKHIFIVVMCVYGLGLYHYYIHRSGVTSYYAVCIPFIMVICFWLKQGIALLAREYRRLVACVVVTLAFFALITSYFFTYYPNVLNLAKMDWKQESTFYKQAFDFKEDAQLIQKYTNRNERVALISSFETRMLMQADRTPFFYYFPLIESSLMQEAKTRHTYLLTYARLQKTLTHLKHAAPPYIFVEDKLWNATNETGLKALLDYVKDHYAFKVKAQYVSAWEIKS